MTASPVVTIHLIDYDTTSWIWVPHIWPHDGFAGPEAWADAASKAVTRRSWVRYLSRRLLREDLVQMSRSRDGRETHWSVAYAPNLSQVARIARIDAHDRANGVYESFEQLLQLDRTDLEGSPVVEPFYSRHLGHGVTKYMERREADGTLAGVRGYGWELDAVWVSLTVADFNTKHLARIRPHLDEFARSLAFDVDDGSGPVRAYAKA